MPIGASPTTAPHRSAPSVHLQQRLPPPGNVRAALRYDKMHLVPLSRRIPFDDVIPILNSRDRGGDFVAGRNSCA